MNEKDCPKCGINENVVNDGSMTAERDDYGEYIVRQPKLCLKCGSGWDNIYKLYGQENIGSGAGEQRT